MLVSHSGPLARPHQDYTIKPKGDAQPNETFTCQDSLATSHQTAQMKR